jgi:Fe-S-cluster containining protein
MNPTDQKQPWYIAGLAFECQGCGRCCAGPEEGYVWLNDREVAAIAEFLGIDEQHMRNQHIRRVGRRLSIKEQLPSHDCMFLNRDESGKRTCGIYPVRPAQCRTWPHWNANLRSPEDWSQAADRCRGINRGRVFTFSEIEARRAETSDG